MPTPINQAGSYRGQIVDYGLFRSPKSGSRGVAVNIVARIDEIYDEEAGEWLDWRQYQLECSGQIWIVKADGQVNQGAVQSLCNHAGWNADIDSILLRQWGPSPTGFTIEPDDYRGEGAFRIAFVNDYERVPMQGQLSNVDNATAEQLKSAYGPALRALLGAVRNNARPAGPPPVPPPAASAGTPATNATGTAGKGKSKRKPAASQPPAPPSPPAGNAPPADDLPF